MLTANFYLFLVELQSPIVDYKLVLIQRKYRLKIFYVFFSYKTMFLKETIFGHKFYYYFLLKHTKISMIYVDTRKTSKLQVN